MDVKNSLFESFRCAGGSEGRRGWGEGGWDGMCDENFQKIYTNEACKKKV